MLELFREPIALQSFGSPSSHPFPKVSNIDQQAAPPGRYGAMIIAPQSASIGDRELDVLPT